MSARNSETGNSSTTPRRTIPALLTRTSIAVCVLDAGNGILDRAIRVYIHRRDPNRQAFRFRSFRKLRGTLWVSHRGMNRVAGASERQCSCQANAFVCAGDQCIRHARILSCAEARLFHVPVRTHQDGFFLYEFAFPSSDDDGCQAIPQNIDCRSSHVHQLIDSEDDKYWFYRQMK